MRNCPVAHNLRRNTLRNFSFAWNGQNFISSLNLSKTPCATFLLLEIGVQPLCATVVLLQIGPYCKKAKACEKRQAQLSYCSKFAPSQTAQLSFCSKLGRIVRKLKPVGDCVRNCPVNSNWCLFLKKSKDVCKTPCAIVLLLKICVHTFPFARHWPQIILCNCRFAWNWPVL